VPQLALRVQGELQLFDDPEVLEYPWDLSPYDAAPTADDLARWVRVSRCPKAARSMSTPRAARSFRASCPICNAIWAGLPAGELGRGAPRHLAVPQPARAIAHPRQQASLRGAWLTDLLRRDGFTLARANLQKFLIRNLLEARIRDLRRQAVGKAFQQALFGDDAASRVAVTDQYAFEFHAQAYAPSRDYDGRFGHFDFRKHFYGRIGDFDSKEEFECACWLDIQAQQGRIQFWVRNLVRREGSSFFLQKADGRFYPDFLCQLPGTANQPGRSGGRIQGRGSLGHRGG
jgi:type III restriction enzyme